MSPARCRTQPDAAKAAPYAPRSDDPSELPRVLQVKVERVAKAGV